jgi:hypothetical protein
MFTRRRTDKFEMRRPVDTNQTGRRGAAYDGPKVNKDRDNPHAVTAYDEGYRGKTQKQRRRPWYQD